MLTWIAFAICALIGVAWWISSDRELYAECGTTRLSICDGNLLWFELYDSVPWSSGAKSDGDATFWIHVLELRGGFNLGRGYWPWIGIELRRGIPLWQILAVFAPMTLVLSVAGRKRRRLRRCRECGYDLTGNESGVCSECGEKIAREVRDAAGGEADGEVSNHT